MEAIKKILLWRYERTTWQWDVLCLLILAFIFLTPQKWFENTEFTARKQFLRQGYSTVLLENPGGAATRLPVDEIERRVRQLTHRPEAKVVGVREVRDPQTQQVTAFEVDIK
jgi:hypothetical protein